MTPEEAAAPTRPEFTLTDFRRMPIPPGRAHVQPGTGRVLVNVPTNVYVEAEPVTLGTTLLGFPLEVRATPVRYVWAFGDGQHLETDDPGGAYPAMSTTYTYLTPGPASITLTTSYTGEYRFAGEPWVPIDGVAQVVSAPVPLEVVEGRTVLVGGTEP